MLMDMTFETNPEGSQAIPLVLHTRVSQTLHVSPRQRSILLGALLGDAYLSRRGQIFIDHAMNQQAYVQWKFQELSSLAYGGLTIARRRDRRTGQETKNSISASVIRSRRAQFGSLVPR